MAKKLLSVLVVFTSFSFSKDLTYDWYLQFRPRWEHVEIKNDGKKTADALTTRIASRLEFRFKNWKVFGELTAVLLLNRKFSPSKAGYEFVAEEERVRPTEFGLFYSSSLLNAKAGRFRINLNNQRFIGSVDWRQMPQTFDALYISMQTFKTFKGEFFYILGRKGVLNSLSTDTFKKNQPFNYSPVVNLVYKPLKELTFKLYYIDLKRNSLTIGGILNLNKLFFNFRGEYASQKNKLVGKNTDYFHLKLNKNFSKFSLTLGWEYLGKYLITPLATLHKFNGWNDVFLKYTAIDNAYGLKDFYISSSIFTSVGTLVFTLHNFRSVKTLPTSTRKFGNEYDFLYKVAPIKKLNLVMKSGIYNPEKENCSEFYCKRSFKFWIMLNYLFRL